MTNQQNAYIGIATAHGKNDAADWMSETPHWQWPAAIAPGTLGADEGLINALGYTAVAKLFGVAECSPEFTDACKHYNDAWDEAVRAALKETEKGA